MTVNMCTRWYFRPLPKLLEKIERISRFYILHSNSFSRVNLRLGDVTENWPIRIEWIKLLHRMVCSKGSNSIFDILKGTFDLIKCYHLIIEWYIMIGLNQRSILSNVLSILLNDPSVISNLVVDPIEWFVQFNRMRLWFKSNVTSIQVYTTSILFEFF